jgi:surface antigen
MRVGEYYRDPYGQRCATYSQTIWVRGRPEEATGYACRRNDGTWEIIG